MRDALRGVGLSAHAASRPCCRCLAAFQFAPSVLLPRHSRSVSGDRRVCSPRFCERYANYLTPQDYFHLYTFSVDKSVGTSPANTPNPPPVRTFYTLPKKMAKIKSL